MEIRDEELDNVNGGFVGNQVQKLLDSIEWVEYMIQKGDTLSGIAARYNVTAQLLYEKNKNRTGVKSINLIWADYPIAVPSKPVV